MIIHEPIYEYCQEHSSDQGELLQRLYRDTHLKTMVPRMVSGPLQGRILSILAKIIHPKTIVEIGTFTGYATLCLAEGLRDDGRIYTIDVSQEYAHISEKYFQESRYTDRISPLYGDAKEVLKTLDIVMDMVFIDAKKRDYPAYYDLIIEKVPSGGIILADNILWSGKVLDTKKDKTTAIIDDFNRQILTDTRVENVILPIRDGVNVIRKI